MLLAFTTFLMVFLLAFQTQNVMHKLYFNAAMTSMAIAVAQFVTIREVISGEWWSVLGMGIGGACGVTLSIFIHTKYIRKEVV